MVVLSNIVINSQRTRNILEGDLYGQTLIYYYYYLNCRNVPMDSECDNRNSSGSFSMKDLLIDAIIVCTMGLFAMVPVMILLWALDFVQL